MERVRQAIEQRWVARIVQAREARAKDRKAAHLGNMAASVELSQLARDLGIKIDTTDTGALMQRVLQIESDSAMRGFAACVPEQAAQALGEEL